MKLPLFRIAALVACLCSGFSIKAQCWQSVSAGVDHTIAIRDDGSLWAWGFNGNGQLGDGTTINRSLPVQIGTDTNWKSIDAGGIFNLAIKTDGSLWAWGDGFWGQLGLGSVGIQRSSPTRVGTATDWKSVSAGREFSMALKTDGTLWAWGDNTFGQLGFASFTSSPTKVGTATDWKTIFAASTHSLAIKNDGTLWAWGSNFDGQLGDGTTNQKNTPTKIGNATDWQTISGGDSFSVAIKINGTLWAWGDNYFNQLGDGTDVNKTSPIQIGSQSNWFSVATGNRHTVASKTDGSLWGWGQNELGQFGDGTYTNKNSPTQSGTATDWQLVIAGEYHTLVFKANGTLWSWGDNDWGKLGDGTWILRNTPFLLSTPTPVGNNIQSFCGSVTLANLIATGTNIKWYTSSVGGSPLPSTTSLTDGLHYYATQTIGSCESVYRLDVTVSVNTAPTPAPTGVAIQTFCGAARVTNLVATGSSIKWYASDTGGSPLANNISILNGVHYYASQTISGCESSSRLDVEAKINTTAAPTGSSQQSFCAGATVNDLIVSGNNITWYSFPTGGSAIANLNSPLVNQGHYYATQTINGLESCSRFDVRVFINDPAPPVGPPVQTVCDGTINDLLPSNAYGAIIWYDQAAGGNPLDGTAMLVNGSHYYASQLNGGCQSSSRLDVTVTVNSYSVPNPEGTGYQTFCEGATLVDFVVEGEGIKWYSEAIGGSQLPNSTKLIAGEQYYASQTINSVESCIRASFIPIIKSAWPPSGPDFQIFCNSGLISNLDVSGEDIKWYGSGTGNELLPETTSLIDGAHYFVSQIIDGCESEERLEIEVDLNTTPTPPPTGSNNQLVCPGATLSILIADGADIKWYDQPDGGSILPLETPLQNDAHYYASQNINTCESEYRFDVAVTISTQAPPPSGEPMQTFCGSAVVADLVASGSDIKWYDIAGGEIPLTPDTQLFSDTHYYASEMVAGCESERLEVFVNIFPKPNAPIVAGHSATNSWLSVSAGPNHSVGVRVDGTLWAWGDNTFGQLGIGLTGIDYSKNIPTQVGAETNWKAVTATSLLIAHNHAIKIDGTLWAWGDNSFGRFGNGTTISSNAPVQIGSSTDWKTISSSATHVMAIKKDGTLWGWGENDKGNLGDGSVTSSQSPVKIGNSTWTSVSAGDRFTIAIKSDGSLWAWGGRHSFDSSTGSGTFTMVGTVPINISASTDWSYVYAAESYSFAIKNDGTLWGWGLNNYGQLGDGTTIDRETPTQIGHDSDWKRISARGYSGYTNHAIKRDGTLWGWGVNQRGQLGDSTIIEISTPIQIGNERDWSAISKSHYHTLAIKKDGTLWAWGENSASQLGIAAPVISTYVPQRIPLPYSIVSQIFCSDATIADLEVAENDVQWFSSPTSVTPLLPSESLVDSVHYFASLHDELCESDRVEVIAVIGVPALAGNSTQNFCLGATIASLSPTGAEVVWYDAAIGGAILPPSTLLAHQTHYYASQTLNGCESVERLDVLVTLSLSPSPSGNAAQAFCNNGTIANISASGSGIVWYDAPTGGAVLPSSTSLTNATHYYATQTVNNCESVSRLDVLVTVNPLAPAPTPSEPDGWKSVSAGAHHSVGIKTNGTLWAWGDNYYGQLGAGFIGVEVRSPLLISTDTDWNSIAAGSFHNAAIKNDGTLWVWGTNSPSQLNNPDYGAASTQTPTQLGTAKDWQSVSAGYFYTVAIKTDGTLWTWNYQSNQRMENAVPAQIGTDKNWMLLSAGLSHTLAIKSNGTLWAWGKNYQGQLGDGTTVERNNPVQIGVSTDWKSVTAGGLNSFATKTDGTLWSWGVGDFLVIPQLEKLTPKQFGVDTDWASTSTVNEHIIALKTDGTLWAWGSNYYGELGNGTASINKTTSPGQIGLGGDWKIIAAGTRHSMALKNDGTLWTWGSHGSGQLGLGFTGSAYSLPQHVYSPAVISFQALCLQTTIADLNVVGENIKWYSNRNEGTPLTLTTPLVNGSHYFATQTISNCESFYRLEIIAINTSPPPPPNGASVQNFCQATNIDGLSITGREIKWYASDSGGSPLSISTPLLNASHYYASQSIGSCESVTRLDVTVSINLTNPPTGNSTQTFCGGATVSDLVANGTGIKWYSSETQELPLTSSTLLANNTYYYASQTLNSCESAERLDVLVTVNNTPAPTGFAFPSLCPGATFADIPITGTGIKWYASSSGGSPFSLSAVLAKDTYYYASQTLNSCESPTRFWVLVSFYATSAPTGNSSQTLCFGSTIANLSATGSGIKWYSASTGGTPLSSSTILSNGSHYYASQTVNYCESQSRLNITVSLTNTNAPTGNASQTFCEGSTVENLAVAGSNVKWYPSPSGGTPISFSTFLTNTAQYYATQTVSNCESQERLTVTTTVIPAPPAPTGNSPQTLEPGKTIGGLVAIGSGIKWYQNYYDAMSHNHVLMPTLPLVSDSTYYATQTVSGCESIMSLAVEVVLVTGLEPIDVVLNFYPNPTTSLLYLVAEKEIEVITVQNTLGQIVFSKSVGNSTTEVDLSGMQSQIYLIQVKMNGGVKQIKVVKN